ncbi:GTPase [Isoptericola sp. AK164]|uniref:GTPase n=1 Tax=Isoptericola sp. AK164 TaxID=3024246 RepID=UPI0024181F26|nr:GTPase [Isoptericola sp. AK164]
MTTSMRTGRLLGGRSDVDADTEIGLTVYDVAKDLRRDVAAVRLPMPIDGAAEAEGSRDRLLAQLDEHLLPRLAELSSPAIVVVAGSTGAGKSTLYNSLLGEEVSAAGVLRPTTREPVLAFNPADADVIAEGPVTELSRVVHHAGVPRGTALLDAPDLDSFVQENRSTAQQLLEAADLWLFVTTASRYGDALPWQALARATERGASVAMVLNRVPHEDLVTIRGDLMGRLRSHGMVDTPLFVVPDVGPHEGLLDDKPVAQVKRWLTMLAGPERSRAVVVRTLKGSLNALPGWVTSLADAVEAQAGAATVLRRAVEAEVPAAEQLARDAVGAGVVAGAAVEARWRELSGTAKIERLRFRGDQVRSSRRAGRARSAALEVLRADVREGAAHTLTASGARVADRLRAVLDGPSAPPGGSSVLPDPDDRAADRETAVPATVTAWADAADERLAALLAEDAPGPVTAAVRAFGDRGLATLVLAAAAGSDDARRLLDRVLGDALDEQVAALRDDLADRAAAVVDREVDAVLDALDSPDLTDDAATALRLRLAELRRLT